MKKTLTIINAILTTINVFGMNTDNFEGNGTNNRQNHWMMEDSSRNQSNGENPGFSNNIEQLIRQVTNFNTFEENALTNNNRLHIQPTNEFSGNQNIDVRLNTELNFISSLTLNPSSYFLNQMLRYNSFVSSFIQSNNLNTASLNVNRQVQNGFTSNEMNFNRSIANPQNNNHKRNFSQVTDNSLENQKNARFRSSQKKVKSDGASSSRTLPSRVNSQQIATSSQAKQVYLMTKEEQQEMQSAIRNGDIETVKRFITNGVNINTLVKTGFFSEPRPLLCIAVESKQFDIVKYFVENSADINRESPLGSAAALGNLEVVKYLFNHKADINGTKNREWDHKTPLNLAIRGNHKEIVEYLVERGADINKPDMYGKSALHEAINANNFELVKYLLEHGANLEQKTFKTARDSTIFHSETNDDYFKQVADATPLQVAARKQLTDIVEYLIKQGANVNCYSSQQGTLANIAISQGVNGKQLIEFLLENGLDPNFNPAMESDNRNHSAALISVIHNWRVSPTPTINLFLDYRANKNITDNLGRTPLMHAAIKGYMSTIQLLLKNNLSPYVIMLLTKRKHQNPLSKKKLNYLVTMIEKNSFANINAKDIDGRTALMHAIKKTSNNTKTKEKNRTDVVRLLINKGANVNAKDANKWTPLIYAAQYNFHEVAQILVRNGADIQMSLKIVKKEKPRGRTRLRKFLQSLEESTINPQHLR